MTSKANKKLQK